jgi:hypothetical protein
MTLQMPRPTLNLDFRQSLRFPPRLSFARAGTLTYRNEQGDVLTAQANTPRVGKHPTSDTLPSTGLILAATETCSMPTTSFLKAGTGTMLWVGSLTTDAISQNIWALALDSGSNDNVLRVRMDTSTAGRLRLANILAGTAIFTTDLIYPMLVDTRYAIAVSWSGDSIFAIVNDTHQVYKESVGGVGTMDTLSVGSIVPALSGSVMNGAVERLTYWPFAMTLQQLRGLTVL